MKILHIEDWFHPEMGYQVNFISKYHCADFETYILATDSFELWKIENVSEILEKKDKDFEKKYDVRIIRAKNAMNSSKKYGTWIKNLKKTIREINPDIIYTHGIETFNSMRIILGRYSKKYTIVSDTHTLLNQFQNSFKFKLYMWFFKNVYVRAINRKNIPVFYTTNENHKILTDIYGIKNENTHSFPIGTDASQYFFDENERKTIRTNLQIPENEKIILYTGKFSKTKQPHLILLAVQLIEEKLTERINIVFVGSKEQEYFDDKFRTTFSENVKVHILQAVSSNELYKFYSAADFAVFPKENTLSSMDAQLCKLPVIMENDTTNAERLQKGGLLFEPDNLQNLADKIFLLLTDTELRQKLALEGCRYISEKYNYKRIIEESEKVLRTISIKHRKSK